MVTNGDISMRVLELRMTRTNEVMAGTIHRDISDRNRRIEEWQARWEDLREAIDAILVERGEELADVPGGVKHRAGRAGVAAQIISLFS